MRYESGSCYELPSRSGWKRAHGRTKTVSHFLLLGLGELLQREGVAHVSQWFVAGKANCLVHTRLELLFVVKNRVVPTGVAQHLGDILAPTLTARHRRVLQELVTHKEAVRARERFIFSIKFCRIHLS